MNSLFNLEPKDYEFLCLLNSSIKINEHNHPIIFVNTPERFIHGKEWTCNKCNINFSYDFPSFYCTFCDFDLCQNCLGKHKLNEIELYEYNNNNNNIQQEGLNNNFQWRKKYPGHIHLLTLIKKRNKNYSWKCNKCSQTFQNDNSAYYCSLCDWYLCQQCFNGFNLNNFQTAPNVPNIQNTTLNWPSIIPSSSPNVSNKNDDFQVKSFVMLNKEYQNNNLLYCPLPVQILFTILANGITEGNALNEVKNVFSIQNLENENQYYINLLNSISNTNILNIANSILTSFEPSGQFKAILARYRTVISSNINELNNFINQNTNGKVSNYYKSSDFFNVLMTLTNVLYFKADWKYEFEKCPGRRTFTNSKGQMELDFIKKRKTIIITKMIQLKQLNYHIKMST